MTSRLRFAVIASVIFILTTFAGPNAVSSQTTFRPVAMVSGSWRIVVRQFAIAPSFVDQGLDTRDGRQWGVLLVSVTNVGTGGELSVVDVLLDSDEVHGDPNQSVRVSRILELNGIGDDGVMRVPENGIVQAAVVLDIPENTNASVIRVGEEVLNVEMATTNALDLSRLPVEQEVMKVKLSTVASVDSVPMLTFALESGGTGKAPIYGLEFPEDCHSTETLELLQRLVGNGLWVEELPQYRYPIYWVNDDANGRFVLLDQLLVDAGAVNLSHGEDQPALFRPWLRSRAQIAEENGMGGFGACGWTVPQAVDTAEPTTEVAPIVEPTETPQPTPPSIPRPTPTPQSEVSSQDQTFAVARDPNAYIGETVVVSGIVFVKAPDSDLTYFVITDDVNNPRYAFAISYTGNVTGISEGDRVTVTGVVMGVEDLGMGDLLPLIIATDID